MNTHDIDQLIDKIEASAPMDIAGRSKHIHDLRAAIEADRKRSGEPVAWLYEDELPDNYPYDTMFPYSKVDGVRMFPVYAPQPAEPVNHSVQDCPEDDKWNCKYCKRVNSCPVQGHRDAQPAEPVKGLSDAEIREVLLEHGFTIKPGHDDLKPYVYQAARELLARYGKSTHPTFKLGDRVRKIKGSNWKGRVVGTYSTTLTPEGYAVESETETGSVQIYPVAALELMPDNK